MMRTKASTAQLAFMTEHMNAHPEMASGRINSLQGRADLEKMWVDLANQLNALGGPIKSVIKWKQAWREFRNNVKKKAMHNKNEFRGYGPGSTGNGPSTLKPMSAVDEQVLSVMGPVAVYGMDDVIVTEPSSDKILPTVGSGYTSPLRPLSTEPGCSQTEQLPVHPTEPELPTFQRRPRIQKRCRIIPRQDDFDTNLLKIEEKKIKLKMEHNEILKNRNAVLSRIANSLEIIASQKSSSS